MAGICVCSRFRNTGLQLSQQRHIIASGASCAAGNMSAAGSRIAEQPISHRRRHPPLISPGTNSVARPLVRFADRCGHAPASGAARSSAASRQGTSPHGHRPERPRSARQYPVKGKRGAGGHRLPSSHGNCVLAPCHSKRCAAENLDLMDVEHAAPHDGDAPILLPFEYEVQREQAFDPSADMRSCHIAGPAHCKCRRAQVAVQRKRAAGAGCPSVWCGFPVRSGRLSGAVRHRHSAQTP